MDTDADKALWSIKPALLSGNDWLQITMGYKAAGGDYETWDRWCAQEEGNPERYNRERERIRWNSISADGGIGAGTLFEFAKKHGYRYTQEKQWKAPPMRERKATGTKKTVIDAKKAHEIITRSQTTPQNGIAYLKSRGISEDTCKRFNVGYIPEDSNSKDKGVIIPFPGTDTPYYVVRNTQIPANSQDSGKALRYKYPDGPKQLFNIPALNSTDGGIFIVEGQIDCLSIEDKGFPCVGCNEAAQLIAAIEKHGTTAAYFKIIPDNDETGRKKAEKLLSELHLLGIRAYIYNLPQGEHDANDFLQHDAAGFWEWCGKGDTLAEEQIQRDLKDYQKENCAFFALENFQESFKYPQPIPTGFSNLDDELEGGMFPGLYLLAAITSLGKTTFAMQIADQAAQQGNDVLIFSLEMTKDELIAKSLSRLTNKEANERDRKTTRAILRRDLWDTYPESGKRAISNAIEEYGKFSKRIFIYDGLGDITAATIRQRITDHIRTTAKKPLVIVDYLQIIAPHSDKANERQVLDYNVLELKRISRDLNVPVVAITALNRNENASGATNNALKGSGSLEYTADSILFLQVQNAGKFSKKSDHKTAERENASAQKEAAARDERELEIEILKNRHGGKKNRIHFIFNAKFNLYIEGKKVPIEFAPDPADEKNPFR